MPVNDANCPHPSIKKLSTSERILLYHVLNVLPLEHCSLNTSHQSESCIGNHFQNLKLLWATILPRARTFHSAGLRLMHTHHTPQPQYTHTHTHHAPLEPLNLLAVFTWEELLLDWFLQQRAFLDVRVAAELVYIDLTEGALVAMVDDPPQGQPTHITVGAHLVGWQMEVMAITRKWSNLEFKIIEDMCKHK